MDIGIWLSIVGIVLTCIGLFVTVNKTIISNRKSYNQNVLGSFNTTKIVDKRKNINQYHHHSTTTIHQPLVAGSSSNNQNDEAASFLAYALIAFVGISFAIFGYIAYKPWIMLILISLITIGITFSLLVVLYKKTLANSYKYYILVSWLLLYGLIILINSPLFPPGNLDYVISKFTNVDALNAPKILWNMQHSIHYQRQAYFLTFQIVGVASTFVFIFMHFLTIYKIIFNKQLVPLKTAIIGDLIFFILIGILSCGVLAKLFNLN
ncbi:hypothetical protein WGM54_08285 [Paenibacillus polymyxa]|uniref:hypothetical protein n=1 Tax=Paenibacillus polymyxa TaxID=1406 RepID=UPI00307CF519